MTTEGKVSKVAICPMCKSFVKASHIETVSKKQDNEYAKLSNEGFIIQLETIAETQARRYNGYSSCKVGDCVKLDVV